MAAPRPTPLRFTWRCSRALAWFLRASVRTTRQLPPLVDYDLTHAYAQRLSEGFKRVFRLRHEIRNAERLTAAQPCVYVANHRSNLDVVTMCEILPPRTIVVGKREVLKIPFLGKIFERGGNVPINRRDPQEAREAMDLAEARLREDHVSVFLFPEGTRNYGRLRQFKKGAFHLAQKVRVPLVPLVCSVTPGWLSGARLHVAEQVRVLIEVLEPVEPDPAEPVDGLIERTRARMAAALERLEEEVRNGEAPFPGWSGA